MEKLWNYRKKYGNIVNYSKLYFTIVFFVMEALIINIVTEYSFKIYKRILVVCVCDTCQKGQ